MSGATAPALVVLYVILGSGFAVLCGAGIYKTFNQNDENTNMSEEQAAYLREVRERNVQALTGVYRYENGRRPPPGAYTRSSASLT